MVLPAQWVVLPGWGHTASPLVGLQCPLLIERQGSSPGSPSNHLRNPVQHAFLNVSTHCTLLGSELGGTQGSVVRECAAELAGGGGFRLGSQITQSHLWQLPRGRKGGKKALVQGKVSSLEMTSDPSL